MSNPTVLSDEDTLTNLLAWVDSRIEAEVTHRPDINVHKRTLSVTWQQVRRHLISLQTKPVLDTKDAEIAALRQAEPLIPQRAGWVREDGEGLLFTSSPTTKNWWLGQNYVLREVFYFPQPAVVPEGYKLVPLEPTQAMLEAAFAGKVEDQDCMRQMLRRKAMADNYHAMLAAAPDYPGKP